jgi:hypothetical protein
MSMIVRRSSRRCGVLLLLVLAACTGPHDVVQVGIDAKGAPVNVGGAFTANVSFAKAPAGQVPPVEVILNWDEAIYDRRRTFVRGYAYIQDMRAAKPKRCLGKFELRPYQSTIGKFWDRGFPHYLRDRGIDYLLVVETFAHDPETGAKTMVIYQSKPQSAPAAGAMGSQHHVLKTSMWNVDR